VLQLLVLLQMLNYKGYVLCVSTSVCARVCVHVCSHICVACLSVWVVNVDPS